LSRCPAKPKAKSAGGTKFFPIELRAGKGEREIITMLDTLKPVVAVVERAGRKNDSEKAWALLACEADYLRRGAQIAPVMAGAPAE
jgi:hypothetical protein